MVRAVSMSVVLMIVAAVLTLAGAPPAMCGTTTNGVRLDTITLNEDGSRTGVFVYEGMTYNLHAGDPFPGALPRFQVVSMTDIDAIVKELASGLQFQLFTDKTAGNE